MENKIDSKTLAIEIAKILDKKRPRMSVCSKWRA